MVDGWEELGEVKSDHAGFEVDTPSSSDDVSQVAASVFSGVLTNSTELVGVKDSVAGSLKLQSIGEHLLK